MMRYVFDSHHRNRLVRRVRLVERKREREKRILFFVDDDESVVMD